MCKPKSKTLECVKTNNMPIQYSSLASVPVQSVQWMDTPLLFPFWNFQFFITLIMHGVICLILGLDKLLTCTNLYCLCRWTSIWNKLQWFGQWDRIHLSSGNGKLQCWNLTSSVCDEYIMGIGLLCSVGCVVVSNRLIICTMPTKFLMVACLRTIQ